MPLKKIALEYLTFTRKDRIGIIVLLLLLLVVIFLPKVISGVPDTAHSDLDTAWATAMKKLEQKEPMEGDQHFQKNKEDNGDAYKLDNQKSGYSVIREEALFYFDPNTLPADGWKKLGLREKTIHTIQNYLSKGGQFKRAEDLKKVYGLHTNEYEKLAPFIRIAQGETSITGKQSATPEISVDKHPTKSFSSHYTVIDINTADTTVFISLPGIGSKLAARIINFRDKLGGFYSVLQIAETFGLPDSTFQKIRQYLEAGNISLKKININTATLDELKAHPYIRWSIANPLITYRNEHGPFSKLEDIKKVMAMTDAIYNKIIPYLVVQ